VLTISCRILIDLQSEPSADIVPDPEKNTQAPLSSSNDELYPYTLACPYPTIQNVRISRAMVPIIGITPLSSSPLNADFSHTWDTDQPRTSPAYAPSRRSSVPGPFKPAPAARLLRKKRSRTLPSVLPTSTPGSRLVSSELSNPDQSGTSSSPTFRVGEDESVISPSFVN
jgi:hypothetical protein